MLDAATHAIREMVEEEYGKPCPWKFARQCVLDGSLGQVEGLKAIQVPKHSERTEINRLKGWLRQLNADSELKASILKAAELDSLRQSKSN